MLYTFYTFIYDLWKDSFLIWLVTIHKLTFLSILSNILLLTVHSCSYCCTFLCDFCWNCCVDIHQL